MSNEYLTPICFFVYNRFSETKRAIEALQKNTLASESELFIFSDASRKDSGIENVNLVREYIKTISGFKNIVISEATKNKGLAKSIIEGVTTVIKKYGRVIVLEDDLLTSPNFLSFMNQALNYYESNRKIISVTGCTFKVEIPDEYPYDVYFARRMSSYGWGTWLNRWDTIDWGMSDYKSFKYSFKKNIAFMKGGQDLPRMLAAYMNGKINSWAIRFAYHQYKTKTYTVYPTVSKIDNIGFGLQATNTKRQKKQDMIDYAESEETTFSFAKEAFIDKIINKSFLSRYTIISRIIANYFG